MWERWRARVRADLLAGFELYFFERTDAGRLSVITQYEVELLDEAVAPPLTGCIRLTEEAAQDLLDQLYQAGLRPSDKTGTPAHVEALQAHLVDVRAALQAHIADLRDLAGLK